MDHEGGLRRAEFTRAVGGVIGCLLFTLASRGVAATLPAGFQESVVFSGLNQPTAVRFSSDGRVFVTEKSGVIKAFDSLTATTPVIFADLRTNVHNFWDRGLMGLALHPDFPSTPYVYVLYTLDAAIGGSPPLWGSAGVTSDGCPNPPGATTNGCVVGGRLSRLQAAGNVMSGADGRAGREFRLAVLRRFRTQRCVSGARPRHMQQPLQQPGFGHRPRLRIQPL